MPKVSSKKNHRVPTPQLIKAVQNYILGAGKVTQEQAMIQAGYARSTAKKQCQIITDHPLYHEWITAKAAEIEVSKGFINLRYLKKLIDPNLKWSEERGILQDLARINGYWEGDTTIVPTGNSSVNLTQIIQEFKGKSSEELKAIVETTKNRLDRFIRNSSF